MKRLRRWLLIVGGLIVLLILLAFIFISPITKYLIEKYDVKYTGREITIEKLFLNLFSGSASIGDCTIFEKDGKTAFFKAGKMEVTISLFQLLRGRYDISKVMVDSPVINIVQEGSRYNYDDLVDKIYGTNVSPDSTEKAAPVYYWIRNIEIKGFAVTYVNTLPYNKVAIQKGNLLIPLIAWDNPIYNITCGFSFDEGGTIQSQTSYNSQSGLFQLALDIKQFSLSILYPYLKDYMRVNTLEGEFSTVLAISGNANKPEEMAAGGILTLEKLTIVDYLDEKLLACQKVEIKVDSINTAKNLYDFSTVILQQPFIKFAMYDDGFNFERLLKIHPSNDTGSTTGNSSSYSNVFVTGFDYLNDILKNYVISNYNADKLLVTGGNVIFTDYTLDDKFQYRLDSLNIFSDRINSQNSRIAIEIASLLNRSGSLKGSLYVKPDNFQDLELNLEVSHLLISDFNPYSKYYVATPFLDGDIYYTNKSRIQNRRLVNNNELTILHIRAGNKVKNKTAMHIPVRLAVSLLKDVKGDIHLKIPVTGSLDDPKFRWGKIVWQVLKNLMAKAVAAPFRLLAGKFGGTEADYRELVFDYEQRSFSEKQIKQIDQLVAVLHKDSSLNLELIPRVNGEDEAEYIATNLAKRRFLKIDNSDSLTDEQQKLVNDLSLKDSSFIKFINQQLGPTKLLSIQEKCIQWIGKEKVGLMVNDRNQRRNLYVRDYFVKTKGIEAGRIIMSTGKDKEPLSRNEPPKYLLNISIPGEEIPKEEIKNDKPTGHH